MKSIIALVALAVATASFACEAHDHPKKEEKKPEVNCVTKDKKGDCPPAPKGEKPTPKKVEKKEEAKK